MRSLVIDRHDPVAETSGSAIRTMNFARSLRRYGAVDLACQTPATAEGNGLFDARRLLPRSHAESVLRAGLRGITSRTPFPLPAFDSAELRRFTDEVAAQNYDVIVLRYLYLGSVAEALRRRTTSLCIIDLDDDVAGSIYDDLIAGASSAQRPALEANRRLLQHYERHIVERFPSVVCSTLDRERLRRRGCNDVAVLPNVLPDREAPLVVADGSLRGDELLFVGSLSYTPNVNGLVWFLDEVYPHLRAARRSTTMNVVGRAPSEVVRRACERAPGVTLHPDVADLDPFYDSCRAVVVPLLAGGGTRVKILEAARYGRPVLSTPIGAEGLDLIDGINVVLFSNAPQFAAGYKSLDDTERYQSVVASAAKTVDDRYSAAAFESAVDALLDSCGAKGVAPPARGDGRVTVVIPLFNKVATIERTIESIITQTVPPAEIIVVDDGSTDGGPEVVAELQARGHDTAIRLLRQPNAGPGAARNNGLRSASTEFIAFLDADDTWDPTFLERCRTILDHHADVGFVATGYRRAYADRTEEVPVGESIRGRGRATKASTPASMIERATLIAMQFVLMRTDVARRNGGYFDENRCLFGEDLYFCIRLLFNETVFILADSLGDYDCEASQLQSQGGSPPPPTQPLFESTDRLRADVPTAVRPLFDRFVAELAATYSAFYSLHGDRARARDLLKRHTSTHHSPNIVRAHALAAAAQFLPRARAIRTKIRRLRP